jgi:hypothetical protein
LNIEKLKNPLYKNIKTNVVIDTKVKKDFVLTKSVEKNLTNPDSSNKKNGSAKYKNNIHNAAVVHDNTFDSKRGANNRSISKINYIDEEIDYSPLLPRGRSLLISTPYKESQTRKEFEENLKNKEKWISKKGFVNKYNPKNMNNYYEIPTYIWQSPPAISIHRHQFRNVNKEKWVGKKEFLFKNSNDLII